MMLISHCHSPIPVGLGFCGIVASSFSFPFDAKLTWKFLGHAEDRHRHHHHDQVRHFAPTQSKINSHWSHCTCSHYLSHSIPYSFTMPSRRRSLLYIAGGALCLSVGVVSGYAVQPPAQISAPESRDSTITSVGLMDDNDSSSSSAAAPLISPATGLPNRMYSWRQQDIRYQVAGDISSPNAVVLVHGLFVNSDHWRKQIKELAAAGYRVYALDLLGSGYSSKPSPWDTSVNELVNGENGRFYDDEVSIQQGADKKRVLRSPSVVEDVQLGTSRGGTRRASVDLRHPLGSFYNFYTWSEQVCDFTRDIVLAPNTGAEKATLVGNSDIAFPNSMPVSIAYGTADPWLPVARTNALSKLSTVDKVIPLPGLGHCPHDESDAIVNPLLVEFIERINSGETQAEREQDSAASPARAERPQRRVKIWNQKLSPAFVR